MLSEKSTNEEIENKKYWAGKHKCWNSDQEGLRDKKNKCRISEQKGFSQKNTNVELENKNILALKNTIMKKKTQIWNLGTKIF